MGLWPVFVAIRTGQEASRRAGTPRPITSTFVY
jgi:hypothetical protein